MPKFIPMRDEFKHVAITDELAKAIGEPDAGTRIYRAEGDSEEYVRWWDVIASHFPRGLVSPGGACPYAGVSRAAVHKAMREGRLTVFAFHSYDEQRGIFGSKVVRSSPYLYLPVVELKAWRLELEERIGQRPTDANALEKLREQTRRELEGEKPDWMANFIDKHPKGRVVKPIRKSGKEGK